MAGLLPDALQRELDQLSPETLVEYLAWRLHLETGEHYLTFKLTSGKLRETRLKRDHISNTQLRDLDRLTEAA